MKKILIILVIIISATFCNIAFAQGPPPPPGGGGMTGGHGSGGNAGPTGAPVGGGLEILLVLGLAYAGKKVYRIKKEETECGEQNRGNE